MKYLFLLLLTFPFLNLSGQNVEKISFNSKYCFQNNSHSLTVIFRSKTDSVFISYYDIMENGNYLNGFDDKNDYAGVFLLKSIRENEIKVVIKSYRDESMKYNLKLSFNTKNGWIYWNIDQKGPIGYLVKHATLKKCK